MKRILILFAFFISLSFFSSAQFFKSSGAFGDSLSAIVNSYATNFRSIQGKAMLHQEDPEMFQSTISLPGSSQCIISRYRSIKDTSASWQAVLYTGDDFNQARKIYRNTFTSLKKTAIKLAGNAAVHFEGTLEDPEENLRFASTSLRLKTSQPLFEQFYTEIGLTNSNYEWIVVVNIFSKPVLVSED